MTAEQIAQAGRAHSSQEAERVARVELARLFEPSNATVTHLLRQMTAVALMDRLRADPAAERSLRENSSAARLPGLDAARDLDRAARAGIRFVIPGDPEWPAQLDRLGHCARLDRTDWAPWGLWIKGPLHLDELVESVAIVGSRTGTTYGTTLASTLAADLARSGLVVVSGGAFGVDAAAHRGALVAEGRTAAVLACGVDRVYPTGNRDLLGRIAERGALISEAPPGCAPMRHRFLTRNRLIAGLTCGTVVVEAAVRSGALNTAGWATSIDRPVMGVPGPVTSAASEGVHELIRSGAASLVGRAEDVREVVGGIGEFLAPVLRAPVRPRDELGAPEQLILDSVPVHRGVAAESVARTAGTSVSQARTLLQGLERRGFVEFSDTGWRLTGLART